MAEIKNVTLFYFLGGEKLPRFSKILIDLDPDPNRPQRENSATLTYFLYKAVKFDHVSKNFTCCMPMRISDLQSFSQRSFDVA